MHIHIMRLLRPFRAAKLAAMLICGMFLLPGLIATPASAAAVSWKSLDSVNLANGTLIRDTSNGRVYLIWANRRHWINSPATLSTLGYSSSQAVNLPTAQVQGITDGTVLGLRRVASDLIWPYSPITSDPVRIDLGQPGVAAGQTLRVSGSGFTVGESITIDAPGGNVFNVTADSSGNFTANAAIGANVSTGIHHVFVQGNSSGLFGVEVFHVIANAPAPVLSTSPNPVALGSNLSVAGVGFAGKEQVQIFLAGGAATVAATANDSGAFGPVALPVPGNLDTGSHTVRAVGASSYLSVSNDVSVMQPAPPPVVKAQVAVAPPSVSPGAQTAVSGSGFAAGELVLISLNGVLQANVNADASGNFGGVILTLPAGVAPGTYTVGAVGATSGRSASASLSVNAAPQPAPVASISVIPTKSLPGAAVVVAGTGFAGGETVSISFNGGQVQSLTADAAGSFGNGSFFVPANLPPGTYTISARGTSSGRSASVTLVVAAPPPVITAHFFLNPSTVTFGGRVALGGSGFNPGELVILRLNGALLFTEHANAGGTFAGTLVARLGIGGYTVTATGATSGRAASAVLHVVRPVIPGIGLIPNRAHRGGTVKVNGNNFVPGELVLIRFRGTLMQAVQTDGLGRFSGAKFVVPGNAPIGVSSVSITGVRSGRSASASLQVTPAPAAGPHISVSASTLHRGSTVSVSGRGFMGGETVLIRFRGQLIQASTADGHGAFSRATFRVPVNTPYGTTTISATGGRSGRSTSVRVRITAVTGPGISVLPRSVARGGIALVSGHGFAGGEIVLIRVDGKLVQAGQADRSGNFRNVRFTVPRNIPAGLARVQVTGGRSNRKVTQVIVVR